MELYIKRFIEPKTKTHTYIISNSSNEAIIIDSVFEDLDQYLDYINTNNLNLLYSLDTHVHADHITCADCLRSKTGCKVAIGEYADVANADVLLKDGDVIKFGNLELRAIYTPGHTIESCCYLINDRLFTGDTLFINGCGRTDFQHGSSKQLYNSIFNRLLSLPDETLVYPGHDYNNKYVSTILEQKLSNPRLQVCNRNDFMHIMDNLNLPKPENIDVALPRNKKSGAQ